jgi:hypothetical protein
MERSLDFLIRRGLDERQFKCAHPDSTQQTLVLPLPQSFLLRADEVIQLASLCSRPMDRGPGWSGPGAKPAGGPDRPGGPPADVGPAWPPGPTCGPLPVAISWADPS